MAKGNEQELKKTYSTFSDSPPMYSDSAPDIHVSSYDKGLTTEYMLAEAGAPLGGEISSKAPLKLNINTEQHKTTHIESLHTPIKDKKPVLVPATPAGHQATDGEAVESPAIYFTHGPLFDPKTPESFGFQDVSDNLDMSADCTLNNDAMDVATASDNIVELLKSVSIEDDFEDEDYENKQMETESGDDDMPDHQESAPVLSTDGNRVLCHPTEDEPMIGSFGFIPIDSKYDELEPSTRIHDSLRECDPRLDEGLLSVPEQVQEDTEPAEPEVVFLGHGTYGNVYKFVDDGIPYVVKNMKVFNAEREEVAKNEVDIMQDLDHPNVVRFEYMYPETTPDGVENINLVLECMEGGSLEIYCARKGPLQEQEVIALMKPILRGMNYIHSQNVVHRDIKPDNLLLDSEYRQVKIGDFGTAHKFDSPDGKTSESNFVGTARYCAPEVCQCVDHGLPADVWSLGVTMVRMINGEQPYSEMGSNDMAVIFKVGSNGTKPAILESISDELSFVIDRCMEFNPEKRITVPELLALPIFQY